MLGIKSKFGCPSCGNLIAVHSPFWNKDLRKKVAEPKKCGCGRKGNFELMSFEPCQYEIIEKGFKVVEDKEEDKSG